MDSQLKAMFGMALEMAFNAGKADLKEVDLKKIETLTNETKIKTEKAEKAEKAKKTKRPYKVLKTKNEIVKDNTHIFANTKQLRVRLPTQYNLFVKQRMQEMNSLDNKKKPSERVRDIAIEWQVLKLTKTTNNMSLDAPDQPMQFVQEEPVAAITNATESPVVL